MAGKSTERHKRWRSRTDRRRLELWLEAGQYQALAEQAREKKTSLAEWARELLARAQRPPEQPAPAHPKTAVEATRGAEPARAGDNPAPARKRAKTPSKPGGRYMAQALENRILALRESGLSLSTVAQRLASEGYLSATGQPYSTGTLSKAEQRARARRGRTHD